MLSNALRACDEFPHLDTDSEHLEFQLHQVSRKIPGEQRMTLFKYCSNNVATHRQHNRRYSPTSYSALVSRAYRVANLPRSQVERVVNYVFIELMGSGEKGANL